MAGNKKKSAARARKWSLTELGLDGKLRKGISPVELVKRLARIKLVALDVDGVLTDTRIFWLKEQGWTRMFSVKDGYAILMLQKAGIEVVIISGGKSDDLQARIERLGIQRYSMGNENKLTILDDMLKQNGLSYEQVLYIGDELMDIPVMEKVGFAATAPHAVRAVKNRAHYVTATPAGFGVVREVCDALRLIQGIGPYLE